MSHDPLQGQFKLRELRTLVERLETGQRMLLKEVHEGSITKCIDIIQHFAKLNEELIHRAQELILIEHFAITGTRTFVRRDGRLLDGSELPEHQVELTPQLLLMMEKMKDIWGEVPHDILEIKQ